MLLTSPFPRSGLVALAVAFCCNQGLFAQTLSPSDDAYVNTAFQSTPFGNLPILEAGGTTSTYIRFDLSSLPSGIASSISKVNLQLWVNRIGVAGSGTIQVAEPAGTWNEGSITSANAPAAGTVVAASVPVGSGSDFIYVDVTSSIQRWLATPSANHGFVLTGLSGTVVYLDSKESVTTSHQPQLQFIPLGGATGPTGPTGATGPTGPTGPTGATG
ncbi:MAG TPA: DNRLRE domain-containing protein, partial [Bryobacteraceae bacterium]|nr:DNRLRE domain-containing protein [Bryobacteraceae bacterium]